MTISTAAGGVDGEGKGAAQFTLQNGFHNPPPGPSLPALMLPTQRCPRLRSCHARRIGRLVGRQEVLRLRLRCWYIASASIKHFLTSALASLISLLPGGPAATMPSKDHCLLQNRYLIKQDLCSGYCHHLADMPIFLLMWTLYDASRVRHSGS